RAGTQFSIEGAPAPQSSPLAREELTLRAGVGGLPWLESSDAGHQGSARSRGPLADANPRSHPPPSRGLPEPHLAADTRRLLAARLEIDDPRLPDTTRMRWPR